MPDAPYDAAKKEVERLASKFKQFQEAGQIKRLGEEETKKTFITPLFRALGWDVENDHTLDEVINEEKVSKGRVDYSFRINGIPKFFLEAKALNKGLDEAKDAAQAINYAWHKGTSWAVLTDFQTLTIYNAEVKGKHLSDSRFISLSCDQFAEQFSKLWWVSKPAFQEGLLDKEATSWGKKLKKTKVGDQLLQELTSYRELLSKNILKNNSSKNLSEEDLDESVQRLIDRLIFIRTAEDRQIEPPILQPKAREFAEHKRANLGKELNAVFRNFDATYNSKLFAPHLCEELEISDDVLTVVISGLYESKDGLTNYDFSAIDADVLGNIYEQYLSHILKKTQKRATVESKEAHRKEQGIYYTPTYIVDYIVKNTLGEALKNKKPEDADKIKVLDMACGSGSFLLKAFDTLNDYYKTKDKQYAQVKLESDQESEATTITRKTKILKNNIYGVDLDPKAVEIAQLNLLLKAAETKHRLPDLRENIKCGNSLIDQSLGEDTRALNWNKEFPKIIADGGFDVIIGNPPYVTVTSLSENDKKFFSAKFESAYEQYNLYYLFIERAISLLKEGAVIGFIVPIGFTNNTSGLELRKYLLANCKLLRVVDVSKENVFKDASTYPIILIVQKGGKKKTEHRIKIFPQIEQTKFYEIEQPSANEENPIIELRATPQISKMLGKIETQSKKLSEFSFNYRGMQLNKIKLTKDPDQANSEKFVFPAIHLRDVKKWVPRKSTNLAIHDDKTAGKEKRELFQKEKILVPRFVLSFQTSYSGKGEYILDNIYIIQLSSNAISTKCVVGLLNSSLMDFYYKYRYSQTHISGNYYAINGKQLDNLPIKIPSAPDQEKIVTLVEKMLILNKRFIELGDKQTDERSRLEKEIAETDRKIDELVYDLYGLTAGERKIVEEAVK
ncbi:MAG: N-6 DNA methylase [Candidatus Micrarchaeia archaeon]